jgi:integrase
MPKLARELSPIEVKRLEHPGRGRNATFAVGGVAGLLLQITPNGGRTWVLRAQVGNKRREMGLGGYPDVTLAQARERAREAKEQVWQGIDPVEQRKAARAALIASQARGVTFADAMEKFLKTKLAEFGNDKHAKQWRSSLYAYAVPMIGKMLVSDIGVVDVLRALNPIWQTKTETASRLRGRIESILAWAAVNGHREGDNPARWRGNLDATLPKPGRISEKGNFPALALDDAPAWFADLREREGMAARALEFLSMCAARSGEIRGAIWDEIDLDTGLWTIPAGRMKAGKEHRVPLTAEAAVLLRSLPRMKGTSHVFYAVRGGPLSDMSISAVMRRMQEAETKAGRKGWVDRRNKRPAVPHGIRSTFRDWAAERTEFPRDMAEISLAHNVGNEVERAYRRGDMVEKRRAMMAAWGRFLRGEVGAKVVQMGARA